MTLSFSGTAHIMFLPSFLSMAKMPCPSSKIKLRSRPSRTLMLSTTPSSRPFPGRDSPHHMSLGVCGRSPLSGPATPSIPSSLEMELPVMQRQRQSPARAPRKLTSTFPMERYCSTHCALQKSKLRPPPRHQHQLHPLRLLQPCGQLLQLLPRAAVSL